MRKFVVVSKDMSGLGFCLLNKSDTVIIARNPDEETRKDPDKLKQFNNVGKGMVDVWDLKDVMAVRKEMRDWYFVFDSNNSPDENEILRKEGFKVCLGGKEAYRLENDREYAIKLSESLGVPSPEWKSFSSADEGIKYLEENPDKAYVYKPNNVDESFLTTVPSAKDPKKANESLRTFIKSIGINDFILQEKVKGIEANLEFFCMDGKPVLAHLNLEMKRISNGDLGNMCGCSVDTGKIIDINSKLARMTIGKYLPYIQKQRWTGLFDCNVIISEQKVYFLEFCARLGYNCHPSFFMSLENRDCLNVMADLCDKTYKPDVNRGWAASVTIFTDHPHAGIPLNIPEDIKSKVYLFDGKKDGKNIVETGGSNELLIVGGYDYRIKDAIKNAYENCEKIDVINMDYRSDGLCDDYASSPIRRYQALMELGLL